MKNNPKSSKDATVKECLTVQPETIPVPRELLERLKIAASDIRDLRKIYGVRPHEFQSQMNLSDDIKAVEGLLG